MAGSDGDDFDDDYDAEDEEEEESDSESDGENDYESDSTLQGRNAKTPTQSEDDWTENVGWRKHVFLLYGRIWISN